MPYTHKVTASEILSAALHWRFYEMRSDWVQQVCDQFKISRATMYRRLEDALKDD